MDFKNIYTVIDSHTGGEPTRTVTSGLPEIPGKTIVEKLKFLQTEGDYLRKFFCREPRGSNIMSAVFMFQPSDPRADFGVIFMDGGDYLPMCGHDTIGFCTAMIESGTVKAVEPYTTITLETPAGLVEARVKVENGHAKEVSVKNIPSFVMVRDGSVDVPGIGHVDFDVAFGGNVFAIVSADSIGLEIRPDNQKKIVNAAEMIMDEINANYEIKHPELDFIDCVNHVEFYTKSSNPEADVQNAVVVPGGAIDRSPCGTGSSAKLSLLYAEGKLGIGEHFVHESIVGSIFKCRILDTCKVGDKDAVIPEITGSAYVTGLGTLVLDPKDPYAEGFMIV
ncbi:MAG: proline racemase family protein [Lachnospiraceae bacterium]|nr:proline racemase family protein [Lachnospiraceae bacterium]